MARDLDDFDIGELTNVNINSMTVKELKQYIRESIDYVNLAYKDKQYLHRPEARLLDELKGETTKGRGGKEFGYGLKMTKDELKLKAQDLRTLIKLDTDYTLEHGRTREWKKFRETTGSDVSYDDYKRLVALFGTLGADKLEKYGSAEIAHLYQTFRKEGLTTVNLLKLMNKDITINGSKKELYDSLVRDIQELIKESMK